MLYHQISLPSNIQLKNLKRDIASRNYSVMLETPQRDNQNSGYSIYAFSPEIIINKQNGQLFCEGLNTVNEIQDPLLLMQQILDKYSSHQHLDLPFCGGFLGYLGYDYAQYLEHIPQHTHKDIELPDLYMGFYPVAIVIDHVRSLLNICGIDNKQLLADELLKLCTDSGSFQIDDFQLTTPFVSNMTEEEYQQKFSKVMQHIVDGDCYQINLAQRWQAKYQGDPYSAYEILNQQNAAPYSAYINLDQGQIISVSPESFITTNNGICETKPIKGTRPRSNDPQRDQELSLELQQSEKDRAENVMIVDLLRNDLSKVCKAHSVKVKELCALESFAAVHHLVSSITGELEDNKDNTDILAACFPGGSITGAPKISAMKIIEELEPDKRSVYCGCIGYLSCNGKMDTNICIRTLVCANDTIYCWAGGGLVVDSEVKQEFLETQQKVSKILPVLNATLLAPK